MAGKVAQSVKPEDLNLDPRYPWKKPGTTMHAGIGMGIHPRTGR